MIRYMRVGVDFDECEARKPSEIIMGLRANVGLNTKMLLRSSIEGVVVERETRSREHNTRRRRNGMSVVEA